MKRLFDLMFSFTGLLVLLPVFIVIVICIKLTSKGSVLYKQIRVGKNNKEFKIYKFRTMFLDADKLGLLTIGKKDQRVTAIGYYLRKYKLDELPQLLNVLIGDMSFVGPRPEVRKYVDLYNIEQQKVLNIKPGITDLASIEFRNENELLSNQKDPENYYITVIMPRKIKINLEYHQNRNLLSDIQVIFKTIF